MSKRPLDKIKAGLDGANTYLNGSADKRCYRIHVPEIIDIKKIRTRLGLSHEAFAETYGFTLPAVCDWNQDRHRPIRYKYSRSAAADCAGLRLRLNGATK